MYRPRRTTAAVALCASLVFGLSACGGDDDGEAGDAGGRATTGAGEQSAGSTPEAPTQIVGGQTLLQFDGTVMRVFDVAGVDVAPSGDAKREQGRIALPILTGRLDIDTLSGRLQHGGGLRFSAGGRDAVARNFVVSADERTLTADLGGERVALFELEFGKPRVPETGDLIVLPATASLRAGVLADALGIEALRRDIGVGELTINAQRASKTTAGAAARPSAGGETRGVDVSGLESVVRAASDLSESGLALEAGESVRRSGERLVLPIVKGRIGLDDLRGTVAHGGDLTIKGPEGGTVRLRDLFVDTRSGIVYADVGGSRTRMFTLGADAASVERGDAGHLLAKGFRLDLAPDGAAVLNENLAGSYKAGLDVADLAIRLVPRLPAAAGAPGG